jgi:hypothetical protein
MKTLFDWLLDWPKGLRSILPGSPRYSLASSSGGFSFGVAGGRLRPAGTFRPLAVRVGVRREAVYGQPSARSYLTSGDPP